MSLEENKAIVRRHAVEWNNQNATAAIEELLAPDFVSHGDDGKVEGIESFRQILRRQIANTPDQVYTIQKMIAEGDEVVVMLDYRYTDPTTGRRMARNGINIYRVAGGKIREFWAAWEADRPV